MCTSPKTIRNPRKHFIAGVDREWIKVPCGNCFECRNKKRNEMYVLSYYEHLQAVSNGGFTQFFTLTYSDEGMPTHGFRPCFSRENIKNYLLNVNSACKRKFGKDFRFRYLVVSEYDSSGVREYNPHHHGLFFVQKPVSQFEFRKILKEYWPYGWSLGSFDNFGVINRPEGIRYVSKYVSKDMFDVAYDDEKISECKEYSEFAYRSARRVLPFSFRSKGFGRFAIAHILDGDSRLPDKFRTDLSTLLRNKLIVPCLNGAPALITLPRSLQRLLFYKCNYRYKKVTPKYKVECEIRGTDIPKYRVESHYVPNYLFKDWKKNVIKDGIEKDISNIKAVVDGDNLHDLSVYRWLSPDYNFSLKRSALDFDGYIDKVLDIAVERSPLYSRCPFDRDKFLVERYEMDIDRVPECVDFVNSCYSMDMESVSREVDNFIFDSRNIRKVSNDILEKTYRDNKKLKYHA